MTQVVEIAHDGNSSPHQLLLLIVCQTTDELDAHLWAAGCPQAGAVEYFVADLQVDSRLSHKTAHKQLVSHVE